MSNSDGYAHCVTGPSGDALVAALDEAAKRCADAGVALTAGRRRVLELLTATGRPLKAYDLMAVYYSQGRITSPITIYRALDFLMQHGLVRIIISTNTFLATSHDRSMDGVTLVCRRCGGVGEVAEGLRAEVNRYVTRSGFKVESLTLEGVGVCRECVGAETGD